MKKSAKTILFLCLLILTSLSFSCSPQKSTLSFEAMNTFMVLQSYGKNSDKTNSLIQKEILQLEDKISTTKTGSDIYSINHANGEKIAVDIQTANLLDFSIEMYRKTDGNFNPLLYPIIQTWGFTTDKYRIPLEEEIQALLAYTSLDCIQSENNLSSTDDKIFVQLKSGSQIDFGAIGKGYAGDLAIELYKKNGIKSALVDLGGNIQVLGTKTDGSKWSVGIKNPWGEGAVAAIKVSDAAVVSSGGYERFFTGENGKRYIHIFDGKTGHPVENETESVTIIAEKGIYADALSTSLFVMGLEQAKIFWKENQDFDMIFITKDKNLYYTKPLSNQIRVMEEINQAFVIE